MASWFISNIVTQEKEEESANADKFITLTGRRGSFYLFLLEKSGKNQQLEESELVGLKV